MTLNIIITFLFVYSSGMMLLSSNQNAGQKPSSMHKRDAFQQFNYFSKFYRTNLYKVQSSRITEINKYKKKTLQTNKKNIQRNKKLKNPLPTHPMCFSKCIIKLLVKLIIKLLLSYY